ncbi:MAG: NAD-dependent epimerase/dehydratase family protein [Bacteroidaceae bacterium]|nr:NAD-dependent epimerase/dehydratase family protein [Bacteroidaceae bacterium]
MDMKRILVTGSAGFIGSNLVLRLLRDGYMGEACRVVGLDNLNDYYDVSLKEYRLSVILNASEESESAYRFVRGSIADKVLVDRLFEEEKFDIVVNLAAQAGVRYSIENPDVYIESNIIGFYNILEACRHSYDAIPCSARNSEKTLCHSERSEESQYQGVQHLVYASSSSVYGGNKKVPFSTDDRVDNPVSLYAATKKSNELMAHCYSKLYNIPSTGLRFFTVYGPAGRPDMAYFGFTNKLLKGQTIQIYNYGNCRRDFTYVDDIVEGIVRVMQKAPAKQTGEDGLPIPPYKVYNIGGGQPENLLDFVNILQEELLRAGVLPKDYDFEAHKQLVPMQPGDVPTTYADATALERDFGFTPKITLREGLRHFAEWYKEYYG